MYTPLIRSFHASFSSPPVSRSDNDCLSGNPGGDVRNLLLKLLEFRLSENAKNKMQVVVLVIFIAGAFVRDIWMLVHHASFEGGIPMLLPLALTAFLAIVLRIQRYHGTGK